MENIFDSLLESARIDVLDDAFHGNHMDRS